MCCFEARICAMFAKILGHIKSKTMGIFGKLFKNEGTITKSAIADFPWHELTVEGQLDQIEKESESKPVVIFKHSTRCGISRMVLKRFEKEYDFSENQIKLYLLDLLNYRDLSQEIASRYNVMHESPQMLVMKNKRIVHLPSHQGISASNLGSFI